MTQTVTQVLKNLEALQRSEPEGFETQALVMLLDAIKATPPEHPAHHVLIEAHEQLLDEGDVDACLTVLREAARGEE